MKHRTIYHRFVLSVMASLIPVLILVNMGTLYSLQLSRQQAAQSGADYIRLYRSETDKGISEIENYLLMFRTTETDFAQLQNADFATQLYAAEDVHRKLSLGVDSYRLADSFFLYVPATDLYLSEYGTNSAYLCRAEQKQYLFDHCFGGSSGYFHWDPVEVNGHEYLLWMYESKGIYLGAWVDVDEISPPVDIVSEKESSLFVITDTSYTPISQTAFLSENGISLQNCGSGYYVSGESQRFIVNGAESESGNFYIFLVFPEKQFTEQFNSIQKGILAVSILALALIPLLGMLIRRDVLNPLKALDIAIREINAGNTEYQIPEGREPAEFFRINQAFNSMTAQLRDYRIRSYEDVIEKQKLRLSYLQMQIRPHFFLNALTTVSNFARLGRQDLLDRFIGYLADYLRYMFRSNLTLVSLHDEIAHIETFLSMQEIRYSGTLSHVFDIAPEAARALLPPFTVHNFAENVIKHAMAGQTHVTLYLQAKCCGDKLSITLEDNGAGLTEDAVLQLNNPDYTPAEGHSIGIWNIRQTLLILYGDTAHIDISCSALGGARVNITLPFNTSQKGANHEDSAV